jgi:excisionase family DNA binding protein
MIFARKENKSQRLVSIFVNKEYMMNEMFYTLPKVAQYLKLSKSKVYHLVQTGQLPHIRIGKNVRVKDSELPMWIDQQSNQADGLYWPEWINQSKVKH